MSTDAIRQRIGLVLVTAFVLAHATLLISTVTGFAPWAKTKLGAVIRDYEALTGADNTFSFFAPHVASQAYTEVTTTGPGSTERVYLYDKPRTEGELRIIAFSLAMQQQGYYDLLAYSLATNALRRNGVESATVRLGYYIIPKLTDASVSPEPRILYVGTYVREKQGP